MNVAFPGRTQPQSYVAATADATWAGRNFSVK